MLFPACLWMGSVFIHGGEMTEKQFRAERKYQAGMYLARRLLKDGILGKEEFERVGKALHERHKPLIGSITPCDNLT